MGRVVIEGRNPLDGTIINQLKTLNIMVTLNLGEIEFNTKADIVNTLNEIANNIDCGYNNGITCGGVCWDIEGEEENNDEIEDIEEENNED